MCFLLQGMWKWNPCEHVDPVSDSSLLGETIKLKVWKSSRLKCSMSTCPWKVLVIFGWRFTFEDCSLRLHAAWFLLDDDVLILGFYLFWWGMLILTVYQLVSFPAGHTLKLPFSEPSVIRWLIFDQRNVGKGMYVASSSGGQISSSVLNNFCHLLNTMGAEEGTEALWVGGTMRWKLYKKASPLPTKPSPVATWESILKCNNPLRFGAIYFRS